MRSQGLPFSTIVLAAIAILILILLVAFVTGGFGKLASSFNPLAPSEIEVVRTECKKLEADLRVNVPQSRSDFENSPYCTKTFKIKDPQNPNNVKDVKCYSQEIGVYTNIQIRDSTTGNFIYCYSDSNGCKCS